MAEESWSYRLSNYLTSTKKWKNENLILEDKGDIVKVSIEDVYVEIPRIKLQKLFDRRTRKGKIKHENQEFILHGKQRSTIEIVNYNLGYSIESNKLWFCHYNTSVWCGIKNFINGKEEIKTISYCGRNKVLELQIVDENYISKEGYEHNHYNDSFSTKEAAAKAIRSMIKKSRNPVYIDSVASLVGINFTKKERERIVFFDKHYNLSWEARYESISKIRNTLPKTFFQQAHQKNTDMARFVYKHDRTDSSSEEKQELIDNFLVLNQEEKRKKKFLNNCS